MVEAPVEDSFMNKVVVISSIIGTIIYFTLILDTNERNLNIIKTEELIYSLERTSSIKGKFTLGIGDIDNSQSYTYYRKNKNNSLILASIDAFKTEVFEGDYVPKLVIKKCIPPTKFSFLLGVSIPIYDECLGKNTSTLYVPKGTIIQKIKLN
jgi:hypothetical protein